MTTRREIPPLRASRPLTLLTVDERCAGCRWPTICAADRTCWLQEADERERLPNLRSAA